MCERNSVLKTAIIEEVVKGFVCDGRVGMYGVTGVIGLVCIACVVGSWLRGDWCIVVLAGVRGTV